MAKPLWTASFLAFVRPLDADDVFALGGGGGGATPESRAEWREISFARRLEHRHGTVEALRRLNVAEGA